MEEKTTKDLLKQSETDLSDAHKKLAFQDEEKEKRETELGIANVELAFQNEEKEKRAAELGVANIELAYQNEEKEKRASELSIANKELIFQNEEKEKRASELSIANKELLFQNKEKEKRASELSIANKELIYQNEEKEKRASELSLANKELIFQSEEKGKRASELGVANIELAYQNEEKEKRASELGVANIELAYQNEEKEKRAFELGVANIELAYQNEEKEKRAFELKIANKELVFQNEEKEKRAAELGLANVELAYQNEEKEKRASELIIANEELIFQNKEKEKRASELGVANIELAYQNEEKEKRAFELKIANKELVFQNEEKEKRAAELGVANIELAYQNEEKEKRASELIIANEELVFQNKEKEKRAAELGVANIELAFQNEEKEKRASELSIANKELIFQNSEKIKRAEELVIANFARGLIEASRDPLFTISTQGKITGMNEASVRITDVSREKLVGTDFTSYFTEPDKAKEGYMRVFDHGYVEDFPLIMMDGQLTEVLFNGSVYKDEVGKVIGAVVVARVITEQKRIEKELTEAKVFAELATDIAEEAKLKAETAFILAENAVKAKQQFLSNMSHEIRTPMNAIIGFTKVILKTKLTSKQKEYLTAIKLSGDSLIVLINDILDLAKVDAGKMTFEQIPFKIALSISSMLHLFDTKFKEKNLTLIKEYDSRIPEVLLGDPVRLHQIILNLVSNAIKFTSQGEIKVKVGLVSEDNQKAKIEFSVKDTGIGIEEDKIKRIFENFQQASSGTSRLYGGTGLGLAIVKQLVETQGGTINVVSKLNIGSTFSFTLDFFKTNTVIEDEINNFEKDVEIRNIKVLVVEDIALNQLLMKTLLDDFGFIREIAANGKIAIEKLQERSYDIILMDLQMPVMNGFECTSYIRNVMNSKIPIIALTADVTTVDVAKCKAVGMNDYIAKPVDEKLLYNKIISLVKKPVIEAVDEKNSSKEQKSSKYTNLDYLSRLTKSSPKLMLEMISLYLTQTPLLVNAMKKGFNENDWELLQSAAHKMIPSFSIMGISTDYEIMAKKIQEYSNAHESTVGMAELVNQLEHVCTQACIELNKEFNRIKINNK